MVTSFKTAGRSIYLKEKVVSENEDSGSIYKIQKKKHRLTGMDEHINKGGSGVRRQ